MVAVNRQEQLNALSTSAELNESASRQIRTATVNAPVTCIVADNQINALAYICTSHSWFIQTQINNSKILRRACSNIINLATQTLHPNESGSEGQVQCAASNSFLARITCVEPIQPCLGICVFFSRTCNGFRDLHNSFRLGDNCAALS